MKKLNQYKGRNIAVFDIETAGQKELFSELSSEDQAIFRKAFFKGEDVFDTDQTIYEKHVGLSSVFGMIVCISLMDNDGMISFTGTEQEILKGFRDYSIENRIEYWAGHYIKKFDMPFIVQRCLINDIAIPRGMDFYGLKPWEMNNILDTHEIWTLGVFGAKGGTLEAVCRAFGVPSPKGLMDGSKVHAEFWKNGIEKIEQYCCGDVLANRKVLYKFLGL